MKSATILIIEDDDLVARTIDRSLRGDEFKTMLCDNGEDGLRMARKNPPDLVILDIVMPGMDGWEVCKEIRTFSQVPILVLSAISKPGIVARALDEGADDYLLKPMPSSVLIAHLKRLARRARAEQESNNSDFNYYGV